MINLLCCGQRWAPATPCPAIQQNFSTSHACSVPPEYPEYPPQPTYFSPWHRFQHLWSFSSLSLLLYHSAESSAPPVFLCPNHPSPSTLGLSSKDDVARVKDLAARGLVSGIEGGGAEDAQLMASATSLVDELMRCRIFSRYLTRV